MLREGWGDLGQCVWTYKKETDFGRVFKDRTMGDESVFIQQQKEVEDRASDSDQY